MRFQDLTGYVFGKLTVVSPIKGGRNIGWLCRCECGKEKIVLQYNLKNGHTKSCGCLKSVSHCITHGKAKTRVFKIWAGMKNRCLNKSSTSYKKYGGRGIGIQESWSAFENFFADMGEPEHDGLTIDRIDNNGDYCKGNCRWADATTQANNRSSNHLLTVNGETRTMQEWSRIKNIGQSTISNRLRSGWCVEDAVNAKIWSLRRR